MRKPVEAHCAGCAKNLTARPELVNTLGREMKGLRAPSRVSITVAWSGEKAQLPQETLHAVWFCVECAKHFTLTSTGLIIAVAGSEAGAEALRAVTRERDALRRKLALARERLYALAKAAKHAHEEAEGEP